jgi:predicted RNase H-like HicB family nuclease
MDGYTFVRKEATISMKKMEGLIRCHTMELRK